MPKNDSCACCGGGDYRKCTCPWAKPFEEWPRHLLDKLKGNFANGSAPHPYS